MTELTELEAELAQMVSIRNRCVTACNAIIRETNEWFDRHALPLRRQIETLRAELTPPPEPKRPRTVSMDGTEDWTEEDRQHYRKLVTGVTRNK